MRVHLAKRAAIAAVVFSVVAGGAGATPLRSSPQPAEFPPASYSASQYVDSQGCVFVRAGFGDAVNWVPRVDRQRNQICGFQPTGVAGAPAQAPAAPVVDVTRPVAPVAAPSVPPTPTQAPAPRVVEAPAPQVMTRAEACAGKTGIQPGYVNSRTGQPLDCGGAVTVLQPVPSAAPVRATASGSACLAAIARGAFSITDAQGHQIRCAPQSEPVSGTFAAQVAAPAAPVIAPVPPQAGLAVLPQAEAAPAPAPTRRLRAASCLQAIQAGQGFYISSDGREVRCAPQAERPWSATIVPGASSSAAPRLEQRRLGSEPPAGHTLIFDDGRLNPHRGVAVLRVATR